MKNKKKLRLTIITLGESTVGKTSLINNFCKMEYDDHEGISTIGIDFRRIPFSRNKINIDLQIWDTAGQERFEGISKNYIRRADGILLVFDLTNSESFKKLKQWDKRITQIQGKSDTVPIMLIGNKSDLKDKRQILTKEGKALAKEKKMKYGETSAKTGEGVKDTFEKLIDTIIEKGDMSIYSRIQLNTIKLNKQKEKGKKKDKFHLC